MPHTIGAFLSIDKTGNHKPQISYNSSIRVIMAQIGDVAHTLYYQCAQRFTLSPSVKIILNMLIILKHSCNITKVKRKNTR